MGQRVTTENAAVTPINWQRETI